MSLIEQKIRELDIIDDVVRPENGSIKETRIDSILDKKNIFIDGKWINCCRYPSCKDKAANRGLCPKHYRDQVTTNIEGETKVRGNRTYKWDGKQWKMICIISMCKKYVSNVKDCMCKTHIKNPDVLYSGTQNTINVFNEIKQNLDIERRKNVIKQREEEKRKNLEKSRQTSTESLGSLVKITENKNKQLLERIKVLEQSLLDSKKKPEKSQKKEPKKKPLHKKKETKKKPLDSQKKPLDSQKKPKKKYKKKEEQIDEK